MEHTNIKDWEKVRIRRLIHFENQIRILKNKYVPMLKEKLKPYLNKQVYKVNGELLQKIEDSLKLENLEAEPFQPGHKVTVNSYIVEYSTNFYIEFKLCFIGGKEEDKTRYVIYYDSSLSLASVNKSILESIGEFKPIELLNFEEQLNQYNKVESMKEELKKEEDKLFYGLRSNNLHNY